MKIKIPPLETAEDFMAFAQKINPHKEELTIEILRNFPGCENYTDEQAAEIIQTLEKLALIIIESAPEYPSLY